MIGSATIDVIQKAGCSLDKESVTPEELRDAEDNLKLAQDNVNVSEKAYQEAKLLQQEAQSKVNQAQEHLATISKPSESEIQQAQQALDEVKSQTSEAIKEVHEATLKLEDANHIVDEAQEAVVLKEQEFSTATAALKESQVALERVQKEAGQASPEAIQLAKQAVLDQEAQKKEAERVKAEAEAKEKLVRSVQATQTTKVEEKADALKQAKQEQTKAEQNFNELAGAEQQAQDNLSEASARLTSKVEAIGQARSGLDRAQSAVDQAQWDYDELLRRQQETLKTLEKALEDAGPETLQELQDVLLKTSSVENLNAFAIPTPDKPVVNEDVRFHGELTTTVYVTREELTQSRPIDYDKVAQYAREYLLELRRINGIDIPVPEVTEKAMTWARARAEEISQQEFSHRTALNPADFGLSSEILNQDRTANSENLGFGMVSDTIRGISEQELAYERLLRYFHDYNNKGNGYGHRTLLLDGAGDGFGFFGSGEYDALVFVSEVEGEDARTTFPTDINIDLGPIVKRDGKIYREWEQDGLRYSLLLATDKLVEIKNEDSDPLKTEYYFNGKLVSFLPKTTFNYVTQEVVTVPNEAYETALAALTAFKEEAERLEQEARHRRDERIQARNMAQISLTTLMNEQQELEVQIASLREQVTALTSDLEKAREVKVIADQVAGVAETAHGEALKDLEDLVGAYQRAEQGLEQATAELNRVVSELDQAQARILELETLHQGVLAATEAVKKADERVSLLQKNLGDAQSVLEIAQAEKLKQDDLLRELQQQLGHSEERLHQAQQSLDELLRLKTEANQAGELLEVAKRDLATIDQTLEEAEKELIQRRQIRDAQEQLLNCLKQLPLKEASDGDSDKVTPPSGGASDEITPPSGGASDEVTPPSGGASDEITPPSGGASDEITPPSDGASDEVTPPSDGASDEITPPSGGASDEITPPSDGDSDKVTPPSDGASDEITPPSGGASDEVTPPSGSTSDEITPPSDGDSDKVTPPSGGASDEITPPSDGDSDKVTPPSGGNSSEVTPPKPVGGGTKLTISKPEGKRRRAVASGLKDVTTEPAPQVALPRQKVDGKPAKEQVAGRELPKTGDKLVSAIGLLGFALCGLAILGRKRRQD